ncbi:hypothetical protein [Actinacidiphila oryziradicis]|uniref:hypothetical protein n=1 Tax=Actinacidiphila oryziradicis TaxID=2571141 RepID=UPI00145D8D53|nr:hypothetical protein [Actinacidiphila oryziradicis]
MPLVLREHPDLARIDAYLTETPRARTRRFAALHPAEQQLRGRYHVRESHR